MNSHHFESILNDSCVRVPVLTAFNHKSRPFWLTSSFDIAHLNEILESQSKIIWTLICFYVTHSPGYHFGVLFEGVFCLGPRVPRDDVLDVCPHLEFMIPPRRVARLSQHCSRIQGTSFSQVVWRSFQHLINLKTSTSIQFHYHSPIYELWF